VFCLRMHKILSLIISPRCDMNFHHSSENLKQSVWFFTNNSMSRCLFFLVDRFHCPRGWRHFGGSCYYLSNTLSTLTEANQTCNLLHSNRSNLMQIRNTVQLFYVVNILTKNNLSALMIEIDRNLLKGNTIENLYDNLVRLSRKTNRRNFNQWSRSDWWFP
jgi:hypothetical protein